MNELEPASFLEILWDFPVYVLRSPVASRRGISPGEGTRRAVGREKSEVVMIQPGFATALTLRKTLSCVIHTASLRKCI